MYIYCCPGNHKAAKTDYCCVFIVSPCTMVKRLTTLKLSFALYLYLT